MESPIIMKAYLLDTNVLIAVFSKYTADRMHRLLKPLKKNAIFYTCGFVLSEFFQGINQKEAEYYSFLLEEFPYLHASKEVYIHAGLTAHQLKKQGKTISLGDCLIASVGKHYQATIITLDKDFRYFRGIKVKFYR